MSQAPRCGCIMSSGCVDLRIKQSKSRAVASSPDLLARIQARLRKLSVKGVRHERNLGIDYSGGRAAART
eukprot:5179167-Pyramimonas_sp.AAC.1